VRTPFYTHETKLQYYEWQNTNKLLGMDFDNEETVEMFEGTLGCKTGVTHTAGPCFSGCFARPRRGQIQTDNVIVVVLGSKSMETRWVEVPALVKWYSIVK
jgi:D-alanyl-D-alanine carboxypeptidase